MGKVDAATDAFRKLYRETLEAAYGRVLARPGLSVRTRELLAVAALQALAQKPQLIAHGRGALRCGADRDEVRAALRCAGCPADEAAQLVQRL